ncbi:MAG: DUF763 domain-containing protein [Myxococcota bacterium]
MTRRTGGADLPLHGGRVPEWLAQRMAALGRVIVEALVLEYGRDEVLRRLGHPFWFQSFGAVMGMDWHSSGITTSVLAALKRGLAPVSDELGIHVCGGRGRASRRTPSELREHSERLGLDGEALIRASRLVAKVDNCAVQDGFQLYLHGFILTDQGRWVVIQQGMAPQVGQARRYHWVSEAVESFVESPHAAIEGEPLGEIVNLADIRAARARSQAIELASNGPEALVGAVREARRASGAGPGPMLQMPLHHDVRPENVVERRLHGALASVREAGVETFESLLLTPGLGPRTLQTLAFVAEVIHGAPSRFSDPARFSLALGGKDGHPFPVPVKVYDDTLRVLRKAIANARLGREEGTAALRRIDARARALEMTENGPGVQKFVERERQSSWRYGGRTVSGPAVPPRSGRRQLELFSSPRSGGRRKGPFV